MKSVSCIYLGVEAAHIATLIGDRGTVFAFGALPVQMRQLNQRILTLGLDSILYYKTYLTPSLVPRLSPCTNKKSYCKRQKVGRGLRMRLPNTSKLMFWLIVSCNSYVVCCIWWLPPSLSGHSWQHSHSYTQSLYVLCVDTSVHDCIQAWRWCMGLLTLVSLTLCQMCSSSRLHLRVFWLVTSSWMVWELWYAFLPPPSLLSHTQLTLSCKREVRLMQKWLESTCSYTSWFLATTYTWCYTKAQSLMNSVSLVLLCRSVSSCTVG